MRNLDEMAFWSAVDHRGQEESLTTIVYEVDYIIPKCFYNSLFSFFWAMVESADRAQTADPMRNSGVTHWMDTRTVT